MIFCLVLFFLFKAVLPTQTTVDQQTVKLLIYTGKAQEFPIWSTKFMAMMQTKGLYKSLLGTDEQPNEPAPLANWASNDGMVNFKLLKEVADIQEKTNNVRGHLALTLHSGNLMPLKNDCVGDDGTGDGAKARKVLEEKIQSVETPIVLKRDTGSECGDGFFIQESFRPATIFTELTKKLQNFHKSTVQRK